jgi:two-component system, cell cycle sensor histidine kinase and response regulator CckA
MSSPAALSASILLVDDEDTVRRVTGRLLTRLGYQVRAAADGSEALRIVEEEGESFDLVLTDIVMPGLSGIQMAERLRERLPDQRILFTSGYTTREFGRPPGEPPEPFMPKPFSLDELSTAVRSALEGGNEA